MWLPAGILKRLMPEHPRLKFYPGCQFVEIDGDALFLGRDCHLASIITTLLNKVVSNRHCVIRREGPDRWMLEDLGSTNGTWVRGTRLYGKILIHTGDLFTLGKNGPAIECYTGFGGTGPNATVPEEELAKATMVLDQAERTEHEGRDGSAERPYRVGRTPEIRVRHQATGKEYTAKGYTVVFGRDPGGAQILIRTDEEKHVSGRHIEVQFRSDKTVVVRDLGSRNGSWLNDKPLKGEQPLKVGDRLILGNAPTVLLVLALDQ